MSQFTIMSFESTGLIAGANIPPMPESPTGSHRTVLFWPYPADADSATTTHSVK